MIIMPEKNHDTLSQFNPFLFRHPLAVQYFQCIGFTLIAASILYLIAANWWMLPTVVKVLIPQFFLMLSAGLSVYFAQRDHFRQGFDTFSAVMLGLSLAVIGQTYQTGADSYLLFLVWAVLLLPWLYRPNIGVFVVLSIVSQLALYFYFQQSYLMQQSIGLYLFSMNALALLCLIAALIRYPILVYGFIAFFMILSIFCMVSYLAIERPERLYYLLSALISPLLIAIYFFLQQRSRETTLLVLGVGIALSIWLVEGMSSAFDSALGLLGLAVLVFIWFALIAWVLSKLLPASYFLVMPLAFGAWLSGIILAAMLLTYWEAFSMFMGIGFLIVAWRLGQHQSSVFLRQLAYCLWVCGQAAVLIHAYILSENWWVVLAIQFSLFIFVLMMRMHWFKVTLQLILLHSLAVVTWVLESSFKEPDTVALLLTLNYGVFIVILLTERYWKNTQYAQSLILWQLSILAVSAVYQCMQGFDVLARVDHAVWMDLLMYYVLPVVWLCLFLTGKLKNFSFSEIFWVLLLALVLIGLGYFEIFILMAILAWAAQQKHKLVQVLCLGLILFWLWLLYYNLGFSFLLKSISIFISGFIILLMADALSRFRQKQGEIS